MVNRLPRTVRLEIQHQLEQAGLESARWESRVLVETVLELSGGQPFPETPLTPAQLERLEIMTARRCAHEPLQYLCGTWEFFGLPFAVGPGVLIPRQDTETLVETVLELRRAASSTRLLDLCSGSGCIPAAISAHLSGVTGDCVELSPQALPYLRRNLSRLAPDLQVVAGDVCSPPPELLQKQYDVITSNPPYLTAEDMTHLQPEVTHEPEQALFGGGDGLAFYRTLTPLWKPCLAEGGWLVYEAGMGQAESVLQILEENGFVRCRIVPDLAGIPRVILGAAAKKSWK